MAKFKFPIRIKFIFNASKKELKEWKAAFSRASQVFYHATEGQLQLGKITVELFGGTQSSSKISVYECAGCSLGNPTAVAICRDEKTKPLVILHELSHHFFDVRDEYIGYSGDGCTMSPSNQACIMEFSSKGDQMKDGLVESIGMVNQYCRADNHTDENGQEHEHHESCIETIKKFMKSQHGIELDAPTTDLGLMLASEPSGHEPIVWQTVEEGDKHIVVLDDSAGINTSNLAHAQRVGARFWVDHFTREKDQIGFVAGSGSLVYPMQTIDNENQSNEAIEKIFEMETDSNLDPIAAMTIANSEIQKTVSGEASSEVSHQSVTFVSTQDFADVFVEEQQIERGNRISMIDIGPLPIRLNLGRISSLTGGTYHNFDQADDETTAFAVQNRLIELALNTGQENGLALHEQLTLPAWTQREAANDVEQRNEFDRDSDPSNQFLERTILVEEGCSEATFVVSKTLPEDLQIEIIDPNGNPVDQNSINTIERPEYSLFKVKKPIAGAWNLKIKRKNLGERLPIKVLASLKNPDLSVSVRTFPLHDEPGVKIMASAHFPTPLIGIEEPVVEIYSNSPDREMSEFITKTTLEPFRLKGKDSTYTPRGYEPIYHRQVSVPPGIYNMVIRFVNPGTAKSTAPCDDCPPSDQPEKQAQKTDARNFVRILKRQIVVAPIEEE